MKVKTRLARVRDWKGQGIEGLTLKGMKSGQTVITGAEIKGKYRVGQN